MVSADPGPGGMFRHFPFFQRLLSWTKPHARLAHDSREYERYDWNSLVAFEPEHRGIMASLMDGSSEFPSRAEMEEGIRRFAERTGLRVRYGTTWQGTSRDGEGYVLHTSAGDYRGRVVIFAVGIAEPLLPETPGIEHAAHYVQTREAATYAGKRLFIIGKQNSGFELASGLLQWASPIILASPRPAQLSVNLHSLGGVRARYIQPWEDAALGGGVFILDAAIERIERRATGLAVHTRRSDTSEPFVAEVDEVIAATGFRAPLLDLEDVGVSLFGRSGLPAMTQCLREHLRSGHLLRGHHRPGRRRPAEVRHPRQLGSRPRPPLQRPPPGRRPRRTPLRQAAAAAGRGPGDVAGPSARLGVHAHPSCGTRSRTWRGPCPADPDGVVRDEGIVSLAEFVDAAGPDGVAITVETDDRGDIHPAVYVRRRGRVDADARLASDPLLDFSGAEQRAQLASLIDGVLG